jgi:hypothetical protein
LGDASLHNASLCAPAAEVVALVEIDKGNLK